MTLLSEQDQRQYIEGFLETYSGKIVAVGDTFDFKRSSWFNETAYKYYQRTRPWHKHIRNYMKGNHDYFFLNDGAIGSDRIKIEHEPIQQYGPALCFHGHQLTTGIDTDKEKAWLKRWEADAPVTSLYYDILEWGFINFAGRFSEEGNKHRFARRVLEFCSQHQLIRPQTKYIIFGHYHLPFTATFYHRGIYTNPMGETFALGQNITITNTGSALKGNVFNPAYVPEIDTWFVSDLHLGCRKSLLDDVY